MSNEVIKLVERASEEDKRRINRAFELSLTTKELEFCIKEVVLNSFAKLMYDDEVNLVLGNFSKGSDDINVIATRIGVDVDQLKMVAEYKNKYNVKCSLNKKVDLNHESINDENQNLDEFVNNMTIEEMNTILNMKASGNYDDSIMNNISSRLGVDVSKLEEIASLKNSGLVNTESNENDLNSDEVVDNNSMDEVENKNEGVEAPSVDNSSDVKDSSAKISADPTPEKRKVPKKLGVAGAKLMAAIANNKGKAMLGVLGIAAFAALAITNPVMLWTILAGAGIGKVYKDFQAGAKGR